MDTVTASPACSGRPIDGKHDVARSIRFGSPGASAIVIPPIRSATNQPPMPSSTPSREAVTTAAQVNGASTTVSQIECGPAHAGA